MSQTYSFHTTLPPPFVLPFEPAFKTTALHTPIGTCHPTVRPAAHLHLLRESFLYQCSSAMTCSPHRTENPPRIPCACAEGTLESLISSALKALTCPSLIPTRVNKLPRSTSTPAQVAQKMRTQAERGDTCPQEPPVPLPQNRTESSLEAKTRLQPSISADSC